MPVSDSALIIWKAPEHVPFATDGNNPFSNAQVDANAGDTVVTQIGRFSGETVEHFRDTGECSFKVDASQLSPDQIKLGYFVDIEGRTYRIETIDWRMEDGGYICEFGGRDLGSYFDDAPCERMANPTLVKRYNSIAGIQNLSTVKAETVLGIVNYFMHKAVNPVEHFDCKLPATMAGIMHDNFASVVNEMKYYADTYGDTPDKFDGVNDYGSIIRLLCQYINAGYRVKLTHTRNVANTANTRRIVFSVYNTDPAEAVKLDVRRIRGLSNVEYSQDSRNAVNQVLYVAATGADSVLEKTAYKKGIYTDTGVSGEKLEKFAPYPCVDVSLGYSKKGRAESYWDMVQLGAGKIVDVGDIPGANELATDADRISWLESKINQDDIVPVTETLTFEYDNSGHLKYGQDFSLGSWVELTDDFLGIKAKQLLTKVTTSYEAGKAKGYKFEFGLKRITVAEKIRRMYRNNSMMDYFRSNNGGYYGDSGGGDSGGGEIGGGESGGEDGIIYSVLELESPLNPTLSTPNEGGLYDLNYPRLHTISSTTASGKKMLENMSSSSHYRRLYTSFVRELKNRLVKDGEAKGDSEDRLKEIKAIDDSCSFVFVGTVFDNDSGNFWVETISPYWYYNAISDSSTLKFGKNAYKKKESAYPTEQAFNMVDDELSGTVVVLKHSGDEPTNDSNWTHVADRVYIWAGPNMIKEES